MFGHYTNVVECFLMLKRIVKTYLFIVSLIISPIARIASIFDLFLRNSNQFVPRIDGPTTLVEIYRLARSSTSFRSLEEGRLANMMSNPTRLCWYLLTGRESSLSSRCRGRNIVQTCVKKRSFNSFWIMCLLNYT